MKQLIQIQLLWNSIQIGQPKTTAIWPLEKLIYLFIIINKSKNGAKKI